MNYAELTNEELATLFSRYREKIEEEEVSYKQRVEILKESLNEINEVLHIRMQNDDIQNIKSATGGTVYFTTITRVNKEGATTDFIDYIKRTGEWQLLKVEPYKKAVTDYVQDTGIVPPGIKYEVIKELAYRKNH